MGFGIEVISGWGWTTVAGGTIGLLHQNKLPCPFDYYDCSKQASTMFKKTNKVNMLEVKFGC